MKKKKKKILWITFDNKLTVKIILTFYTRKPSRN